MRADGTRLSLDLLSGTGSRMFELLQHAIQSQLKQIGIEIVVKSETWWVLEGVIMERRQFTGMVMDPSLVSPGAIPCSGFGSAGIPRESNSYSGDNYSGYSSPRVDAVMKAAVTELDPVKRQVLWNEFQTTITDDMPQIPLFNGAAIFVSPTWMTGLTPPRSTYVPTLWIEYWKPK